jgi:glutaminase
MKNVMALCWAASQGDLTEIRRLVANEVDLNESDYDGRTCIHLAASEGHNDVIRFLMAKRVNLSPKDRWGGTPVDDAKRHGHQSTVVLLNSYLKKKKG